MTSVLLFHSALGLRPAVTSFADRLRGYGHTVHTPDLFDGAVFDDLADGVAFRDRLGVPALLERAFGAADGLHGELVYAGFSMGAAPAQALATARTGARGLVLMHGALPPAMLELTSWPATLPVQVHTSPRDSWVDPDAVTALAEIVPSASWEHHEYPDTFHLFSDAGHGDHDASAAATMFDRVRLFLAEMPAAKAGSHLGQHV